MVQRARRRARRTQRRENDGETADIKVATFNLNNLFGRWNL
jgi:hypothetical protein